jgi:hypothetical protein
MPDDGAAGSKHYSRNYHDRDSDCEFGSRHCQIVGLSINKTLAYLIGTLLDNAWSPNGGCAFSIPVKSPSQNNLTPADVYTGLGQAILKRKKKHQT